MQCPIDKTEMEKGALEGQGAVWLKSGLRTSMSQFGAGVIGAKKVFAYHCPKCGKVELTTETK